MAVGPTRNKSGHFKNCNSQISSMDKRRLSPGYKCNCDEILQLELDTIASKIQGQTKNPNSPRPKINPHGNNSQPFPNKTGPFPPNMGTAAYQSNYPGGLTYSSVLIRNSSPLNMSSGSQQKHGFGFTLDYDEDDELELIIARAFEDEAKKEGLEFKKTESGILYTQKLSHMDLIRITLLKLSKEVDLYGTMVQRNPTNQVKLKDPWLIFQKHLEGEIKRFEESMGEMPKPISTLVKLGMDIDLRALSSTSFVIKPLKGNYTGFNIPKDTYWVFSRVENTPPFYLYEFPTNQFVVPKTDLVFLVDPYTPDDDCLTELEYKGFGISIMRKFDIKDAKILLVKRKSIFDTAPTATNTILLFQLMDAIILNNFKTGILDLDVTGEKNLVRLEKLKNLALSTKYNEERKNAVDKSFLQFEIIFTKKIEGEEKVG